MKKFFCYLFLGLSFTSFAQSESSLSVVETTPFRDKSHSDKVIAIKTTKEDITGLVRQGKRDLSFDIYDAQHQNVFSEVVKIHKKEKYIGDVFYENELKIITVLKVNRNDREVYCHNFNLKTKTLDKQLLFKSSVDRKQELFYVSNKRQTSVAISPNGKYIAIATDDYNKNTNSYTIRQFDTETLALNFKRSYQNDNDRYFEPNDIFVDNEAAVYVVGKFFKEGRAQKRKKEANYEFILNKITSQESQKLVIALEDEFVQSLNISNKEDQLFLIGFYSERRARRIKGSCNFTINKSSFDLVSKSKDPLPVVVYEDLFGDDKGKDKSEKELSNFTIDHFLNDANGNIYILAEEFYISSNYVSTGMAGGMMVTTPHYDNIIILKYDSDGKLLWGRSIFKRSTIPSYNAFVKDDKLHVLLNSGKNLSEKDDGRTKASKGWFESSSLYDFEYDTEGNVSYNKIQDNKGSTKYYPHNGTYENNTFLMMGGALNQRQFMILK
ncbi:hypothetical protein ACFSYG_15655 [Leeuwenhoekiella polynyae]|uniref:6-bladed beta-propeller protein n=1 Tax=Leeuwenhoekiella polynyae TaxID=1550906 RepID=A0A4Q0P054_9FLAO|nr:hypothetical protein [Leeuwenhoekiella polynyae]RXG18623.1 hypothetical protein DSM02_3043 [Leeuwenhoekiella polynyae]